MPTFIIKSKQIRANAAKAVSELTSDPIMEVIIQEHKPDKTTEQRNWWHLLIGIMAKELGYTAGEMKSVLKNEILGQKEVEYQGKTISREASSEELKKFGYSDLIEQTYRIASEVGIILPNPDLRLRK